MSELSVHALSPSESNASIPSLASLPSPLKRKRFDDRSQTKTSIQLKSHSSEPPTQRLDLLPDEGTHLTKLVKWNETKQILKIVNSPEFTSAFGSAVYIELSSLHIAIGTDLGAVVGFNYHQEVDFILVPQKSEETHLWGAPVSSIAFSSDATFLVAGYTDGNIAVWDLSAGAQKSGNFAVVFPYDVIKPVTLEGRFARNFQGHLVNVPVNTVAFVGELHNHLVSLDISGLVFFHHGFKKFLRKYYISQKLLGKNDSNHGDFTGKFMIQDCGVLPIGTSPQITDHIGLMAVMTGSILAIVSIRSLNNTNYANPVTHFKISKSKLVSRSESPRGCLSWYPCIQVADGIQNAKLAYSWNNVLTILELDNNSLPLNLMSAISEMKDKDKGTPKLPIYKTGRWVCAETERIVSLKWLNSEILTGMIQDTETTETKLVFFYYSNVNGKATLTKVGVDDLDSQQVSWNALKSANNGELQTYHSSFQIFRHRLVILVNSHSASNKNLLTGKCLKWADRLTEFLAGEDFLSALLTAKEYFCSDDFGQLVLCGLPHSRKERHEVVEPILVQIMRESVYPLFLAPKEGVDPASVLLLYMFIIFLLTKDEGGPVSSEHLEILESIYETFDNDPVFFGVLEEFVLSKQIRNLSPLIFKSLVEFYTSIGKGDTLTEIICLLDTRTLNIDMTLQLCRTYNLRECSIYIWNELLHDYITPMVTLLEDLYLDDYDHEEKLIVYTYMSYILTGRQFPSDQFLTAEEEKQARESVCCLLFSIGPVEWPKDSGTLLLSEQSETIFPYLFHFLKFDTFEMLVTMNEFFEHPCLNFEMSQRNRQYIVDALLDIFEVNKSHFEDDDFVQLSIFIARNYPKYFQFIRLSETVLRNTVNTLCGNRNAELRNDCELALESLLPVYDVESDVYLLEQMKAAKFYNALFGIYKSENMYSKALEIWLEKQRDLDTMDYEQNFAVLASILETTFGSGKKNVTEQNLLILFVEDHFEELISRNLDDLVVLANTYNPVLHLMVLKCKDDAVAFKYLDALFNREEIEVGAPAAKVQLIVRYIQLLCLFSKDRVQHIVSLFTSTLSQFPKDKETLLGFLKNQGSITALAVLRESDGEYETALMELVAAIQQNIAQGEDVDTFISFAIRMCEKVDSLEQLWMRLVESLVSMTGDASLPEPLNQGIYQCFRHMIEGDVASFTNVFNRILTSAMLSNVRMILLEILTSFFFESEMAMISLEKVNQGIYAYMDTVKFDTLLGWLVTTKSCTSCSKVLWGSEVSIKHIQAWEDRERSRLFFGQDFDKSKYRECEIVLFRCGHGYHTPCLSNLGSMGQCVICTRS